METAPGHVYPDMSRSVSELVYFVETNAGKWFLTQWSFPPEKKIEYTLLQITCNKKALSSDTTSDFYPEVI
jgi:hypothetical protein